MRTTRFISLFMWFLMVFALPLAAQNTLEKFGKNRVQYKKFNWRNLSTQNFDVYYYDNGARLGQFAVRYLETEFNNITDVIGYTPQFKTKIFLFNSISDLQQSNVGLEDLKAIIGGQTDFFKSQVEIPFTGNEVDFKKELRRGVAQMLIREMMFGGSLKDMIQNSYLGKFSEWFLLGAAAYVAEGWSLEMDEHLRDLIQHKKLRKPNLLNGRDAILVGQSIWNYIAEKHGKANISQILNYARILRKERNSISSTLGVRYLRFIREWEAYYGLMAQEVNEHFQDLPAQATVLRKNRFTHKWYNEIKANPAGTWVAYSENRGGKFKVVLQNIQTKKRKVILRRGYLALNQRYDEDLPTLSWRDNGQLGVMYVRKGETQLSVFDMRGKRKYEQTWFYFNHVTGFDFSDDGKMIVVSADRKGQHDFKTGQNDLYLYNTEDKANTLQQVTDDWYDDINPVFLPNSKTAVAFSSNRLNDTISLGLLQDRGNYQTDVHNFDIFIYNSAKSKKVLDRLTDSPTRDILPIFQNANTLLYLSEETGIRQLKKLDLTTQKTQNLTSYRQGLRSFDYVSAGQGIAYTMSKKGKVRPFYEANFNFNQDKINDFQTFRHRLLRERNVFSQNKQPKKNTIEGFTDTTKKQNQVKEIYGIDEVDTDNYEFNTNVLKEKIKNPDNAIPSNTLNPQDRLLAEAKKAKQQDLKVVGPYDYSNRFRTENATTSATVDPIRNLGLLMSIVTSDLLENHKFRGGLVMYADFKSNDFYGEYQYLAKRYDLAFRYDRKGIHISNEDDAQRYISNRAAATLSYPLTNVARVSLSPFYQNTVFDQSFSKFGIINAQPNRVHYGGGKFEYVYDNTIINGQNMMSGTRAKFVWEEYRGLFTNDGFKQQRGIFGLTASKMSFRKITFDARHYQPLHRDLVLALRITGGTFAGGAAKNFLLGGMDNWLFNQTDGETRVDNPLATAVDFDNSNLLFTEFVTNLRGYKYNKMTGNSFFLANAELRFPIFKYLFGQRVNSNFLKNFQIVGFYDIGSAWTAVSPFESRNAPTRRVESGPSFTAFVNDFKSPWLVGYGLGIRTVLLGYYLKLDVALAVEDYIPSEAPKAYLTFGYDF